MLNAILESKSGRLSRDAEKNIRWSDLFRGSEDLVTATLFERLSYLPAETAWQLLATAANGQLHPYRMVELKTLEFWPMWETEDRARGVEPDIFIDIALGDPARRTQVIVEAKHGGAQYAGQLKNEVMAWSKAVADGELEMPDDLIVMAVGGIASASRKLQLEHDFAAATAELEDVPNLAMVTLDWSDLARAVSLYLPRNPHEGRILKDMERALGLYGYRYMVATRHLEELLGQRRINRGILVPIMNLNRYPVESLK